MSAVAEKLEAKYGLPLQVAYCKRCVISNQRPNSSVEFGHKADSVKPTIHFDADGICDACRVADLKRSIDWQARDAELRDLCDQYRSSDGSYDCLLPGSGGKDSFYAAHVLKTRYGMHPLTCTWAPHIYTPWGWRNFQRWIHAGFDNFLVTPNGRVHRTLTRLAVDNLLHPFQPFVVGQKAMAPRLAAKFGIKLVIYGENEAEYGNPKETVERASRDMAYFTGHPDDVCLSGLPISELARYGIERHDLNQYLPAAPEIDVDVVYLGYYLKWRPQDCYYYAVEHGGFECSPERTPGTYSKYSSIDDRVDDFHYLTTFIKFGIGRATYDAAQEIRSGEIDRDEGVALVRKFDGEWPERFADEFFEYLSVPGMSVVSRESFMEHADAFRSPHLWKRSGGEWQLRHRI